VRNNFFATDVPETLETDLQDLNNRLDVVGDYYDSNGNEHGVIGVIDCSKLDGQNP
jgi:hypothetical protein